MADFAPRSDEDDHIKISSVGEIIFPTRLIAPNQSNTRSNILGGSGSFHETENLIQPSTSNQNIHQFYSYQRDSFLGSNETNVELHSESGHDSPFFRPSTPQPVTVTRTVSTPNGTHVLQRKKEKMILRSKRGKKTDKPENKSSILGATSNLVNTIVGAGIIGIPYAMNQTGILAGIILIIIVAILTDKSLRMLIETGKHAEVQSYEMLMEAVFGGRSGFVFISVNMFIMSFGAMVCYLLIIKQTFANVVMGNEWIVETLNDVGAGSMLHKDKVGQMFLIVSSLIVILPLSMQRDMANLSITSTISVVFDILMVLIVAVSSPVKESIEQSGGIANVMQESTIHIKTLFIGLGVLSFAFVCQDSSFIIAGSLHQPTKKRWGVVTRSSLAICATLGIIIGVSGFLGFQDKTMGNVLQNFTDLPKSDMLFGSIYTYKAINLARTLLGLTMFCVYPLASYVARHVLIVLFFSGKTAHSGDDHSVLARWDRRFILTFFLYAVALILALQCDDLGTVLALTGAIAGSCLSYLGPGVAYLGIHGLAFLDKIGDLFVVNKDFTSHLLNHPHNLLPVTTNKAGTASFMRDEPGLKQSILLSIAWYILLMPLWCSIGFHGGTNFDNFKQSQAIRNGYPPNRLGKIIHKSNSGMEDGFKKMDRPDTYGSFAKTSNDDGEMDMQDFEVPVLNDFFLAVTYIIVGIVALTAGIFSITSKTD